LDEGLRTTYNGLGWRRRDASNHSTVLNDHLFSQDWFISTIGVHFFNHIQDIVAADDFAKDDMLVVQVATRTKGNEKLTTIGIRTSIRHRQQTTLRMLHSKGFI
jgi:hypothetical protein